LLRIGVPVMSLDVPITAQRDRFCSALAHRDQELRLRLKI
jgi:hypothetical protein